MSRAGRQVALLLGDTHYVIRALCRRPSALVAVLVLAVGIGVSTAMFELGRPFLLRVLPYERPSELVLVTEEGLNGEAQTPTGAQLRDLEERPDLFSAVAGWERGLPVRVRDADTSLLLRPVFVSEQWFTLLGVNSPSAGWAAASTIHDTLAVVMPDSSFARSMNRGADTRSLRRQDGGYLHLVSVLPSNFVLPTERLGATDVLLPLEGVREPATRFLGVVGRLAHGRTAPDGEGTLVSVGGRGYRLRSLRDAMAGRLRPIAVGAVTVGVLLLLLCGANTMNLMFVRAVYRRQEISIRAALGASQVDLLRLVSTELAVGVTAGWLVGLLVTATILAGCSVVVPDDYVALGAPHLTPQAVAFSLGAAAIMLCAGIAPALSTALLPGWRTGGSLRPDGRAVRVSRHVLAAVQCALAMLLVAGAALFVRSYATLLALDPGFSEGTLVVSASYSPARPPALHNDDIKATLDALQRTAGVERAGASVGTLMDRAEITGIVRVAGRAPDPNVVIKQVSADYFAAMGIRLLAGRAFAPNEPQQTNVVIVNQAFARTFWADAQAVDQTVIVGRAARRVVGVVVTTRDLALDVEPRPTLFLPLEAPHPALLVHYSVRTHSTDVHALTTAIRRVQSDVVITDDSSVWRRLLGTVTDRSFTTLILALFAVAGVCICLCGLFGLVAYVVGSRTREMAIRVALGASSIHVRVQVMRDVVVAAACGTACGALTGWWISRSVERVLYGVRGSDPFTIGVASAVMLALAMLAAWIPATGALGQNGTAGLRSE